MFISAVYIRFFRSFNFDYLRKAHGEFAPDPWDVLEPDGLQYPFIKVPLQQDVTTVVGANESGKSQLLSAIKHALTGKGIERGDFCRYSQFFAVNKKMAFPDFGLEFKKLDTADQEALAKACRTKFDEGTDGYSMFRIGGTEPVIYVRQSNGWSKHPVKEGKTLDALLPQWFEIDAAVPLPQSVPIKYLAVAERSLQTGPRKARLGLMSQILENGQSWFGSPEDITAAAPELISTFSNASMHDEEHNKQLVLADDLLLKVAGIDRTAFQELLSAVERGKDGFANGIVEQINRGLAAALNFQKWWSQDLHFQLLVTLRDRDLVFTIRDRTGTEYSADERSGGLKYFLSYFVQYLAHDAPKLGVREVLLMDEPDAYLSSTGQQDLLRIFEDLADPQSPDRTACQVVYVTHSPFLIDKNHGERIRVLEKGEGDEGARVVRNAARNHYEPLRSAFGGFVAETTFISNCNLMLEGMSDQVMLAGVSARLRRQTIPSTDTLDLNTVTLVPAGSASHIPYLAYLARGRDVDRPAVIVLLDSDEAGDQAVKALRKGPNGKSMIDAKFVMQLGELPSELVDSTRPGGVVAIEDLVPLPIGIAAVRRYADEFLDPSEEIQLRSLKATDVSFDGFSGTLDALERAAKAKVEGFHLDKVGFARAVLDVAQHDNALVKETAIMDANFRVLFRELGRRQRSAMREITTEKTSAKIKRIKRSFLQDYPDGTSRERATLLLEDIEVVLDNSVDSEEMRSQIRGIRRQFDLDQNSTEPITGFASFSGALETLAYREINNVQES